MRALLLLLLFAIGGLQAQEINWMTMNEALAAQEKEPRKLLVDVYTKWCGPCKMMDRNTFSNKKVAEFINANYYAVKFDAEGTEEVSYGGKTYTNPDYNPNRKGRNATHQFSRALGVNAYPSIVYFREDGGLIQAVPGYRTPSQIEIYLKMIANDDYKTLTTMDAWEQYQKDFQGDFE